MSGQDNQYNDILKEDSDQYYDTLTAVTNLTPEDVVTAFNLSLKCLGLSDRWSEIMAGAKKIAALHDENKTDLAKWAYQRYRTMQNAHEICRVIWRAGQDALRRGGHDV